MNRPSIWIVNPYGNLPGEAWREYRSQTLAEALIRSKSDVTWWISNFEHRSRTYRCESSTNLSHMEGLTIEVVPATSYKKNISFSRLRYEANFARNFYSIAATKTPPDMIIVAEPAIFTGPKCLNLSKRFSCPLIIDIIDIWPELFGIALPKFLKRYQRTIFGLLYSRRRNLFRSSAGIVSVSEDYNLIARANAPNHRRIVSYLGIDIPKVLEATANNFSSHSLGERVATKRPNEVWVVYAGTLGEAYDIDAILKACYLLQSNTSLHVHVFLAGDGPKRNAVEEQLPSLSNLTYLGNLKFDELSRFFMHCDIGICSYHPESTVAMPTKFFDYLAAGIAIATSLRGEAARIINENSIGSLYEATSGTSLASAIVQLAEDRTKLSRMRDNAKTVAKQFDTTLQHDRLATFLLDILAKWSPHETSKQNNLVKK